MNTVLWSVSLSALTWAVSAAFNYGIIAEKLRNMKESILDHGVRIRLLEDNRYNDLVRKIKDQSQRIDTLE